MAWDGTTFKTVLTESGTSNTFEILSGKVVVRFGGSPSSPELTTLFKGKCMFIGDFAPIGLLVAGKGSIFSDTSDGKTWQNVDSGSSWEEVTSVFI